MPCQVKHSSFLHVSHDAPPWCPARTVSRGVLSASPLTPGHIYSGQSGQPKCAVCSPPQADLDRRAAVDFNRMVLRPPARLLLLLLVRTLALRARRARALRRRLRRAALVDRLVSPRRRRWRRRIGGRWRRGVVDASAWADANGALAWSSSSGGVARAPPFRSPSAAGSAASSLQSRQPPSRDRGSYTRSCEEAIFLPPDDVVLFRRRQVAMGRAVLRHRVRARLRRWRLVRRIVERVVARRPVAQPQRAARAAAALQRKRSVGS